MGKRIYLQYILNYMEVVLKIDPESEDIGWYTDEENEKYYMLRFVIEGEEYHLGCNKLTKEVESMI